MAIRKSFLVYTDSLTKGRYHQGQSAIGGIIINNEGYRVHDFATTLSHATKYEAKYVALLYGIEKAVALGATHVLAFTHSRLIVNQINGKSRITKENLKYYSSLVRSLESQLKDLQVFAINPSLNSHAIDLVRNELNRNNLEKKK